MPHYAGMRPSAPSSYSWVLRRSLLDPCIFVRHDKDNQIEALVLIEVDDFLIATKDKKIQMELKNRLERRFKFGKWEENEAAFIGRRCIKTETDVRMDQEKYILEKLESISLSKGRRNSKGGSSHGRGVRQLQVHAIQGELGGTSDPPGSGWNRFDPVQPTPRCPSGWTLST